MAFPGTVDFLLSGNSGVSEKSAGGAVSSVKSAKDWLKYLPKGRETYQIVQAAETWPKIIEAVIDPPDVHVGDIQKLEVIVQSPDQIVSVEAHIETDKDTVVVPLKFVKEIAADELQPERYALDEKSRLVAKADAPIKTGRGVVMAADPPKFKYEGEWKVRDTHNTTYRTQFIAKDAAGRENSITLAWSDACGLPNGGDWNLASNGNCTISASDGVDNGNATIATYTLTLNSTFAFNSGKSVSITTGAIAIGSGGQLVQTNIWMLDSDSDTYPDNLLAQTVGASSPGGTYTRRYLQNATEDCLPLNGNVFWNISGTSDSDQDGWAAGTGYGTVCTGPSTVVSGRVYYLDVNGNYHILANGYALGFSDCGDSNASIWRNGTFYADSDGDNRSVSNGTGICYGNSTPAGYKTVADGDCNDSCVNWYQDINSAQDGDRDGYYTGSAATRCVGSALTLNGRSYYDNGGGVCALDGGYPWLSTGQALGSSDCNDSSSCVYLNSTGGGQDADHDRYVTGSALGQGDTCIGDPDAPPPNDRWYMTTACQVDRIRSTHALGCNDSNDANAGVLGTAC